MRKQHTIYFSLAGTLSSQRVVTEMTLIILSYNYRVSKKRQLILPNIRLLALSGTEAKFSELLSKKDSIEDDSFTLSMRYVNKPE